MASAHVDRAAEDALIAVYGARLATAEHAEFAAHDAVRDANFKLAAAQQAKRRAQAALDALHRAILVSHADSRGGCLPLPSDILLEVFSLSWERALSTTTKTSPIQTTLALASVCTAWRQVALSSGRLWSAVMLDFTKLDHAYRFLKMILTRSGSAPLHVQLHNVPLWDFVDPALDETQVLALCSRSRSFRLSFAALEGTDNTTLAQTFLPYFQTPMPLLEDFAFENCIPMDFSPATHIFTLAPCLKRVDLDHFPLDALRPASLPYLASLTLRSHIEQHELLSLSLSWPQLTHLTAVTKDTVPGVQPVAPTFAHLEELDCVGRSTLSAYGTLGALAAARAPCLRKLVIPGAAFARLELFLGGTPYPALESLSVHGAFPPTLISLFPLLPNLAHWTIARLSDDYLEEIFGMWARFPDSFKVAPKLRALAFEECSFALASAQHVVAYLQQRAGWAESEDGVCRIEELRIVQSDKTLAHAFPLWLRPRLEELVKYVTLDTDNIQWPEDDAED